MIVLLLRILLRVLLIFLSWQAKILLALTKMVQPLEAVPLESTRNTLG